MKIQNKLFLMLVIAFSFLLIFNISNVKAATYDLSTVDLISNGYNWAVATCEDENLYLFVCKESGFNYIAYNNTTRNGVLCATTNYYAYAKSGGMNVYLLNYDGSITYIGGIGSEGDNNYVIDTVLYSSVNINYAHRTLGDTLFFQKTPLDNYLLIYPEPEPVEKPVGILAQIVEPEKMEKANLQIRVIIPLIIVVVVSFLGLRKALKMLSQILHRS